MCCLNSDVEVTQHWLDPLVKLMDENPEIAAVMPKIRSYFQRDYFEYAGAGGGYIDRFGYPFCQEEF
jgi:GT2 family glycosyltransferase